MTIKAMPRDEHEFQVLLRKEFESGVHHAAATCEIILHHTVVADEIRRRLLNRSTPAQRDAALNDAILEAIHSGVELMIKHDNGLIYCVLGDFLTKTPFVASSCDTIFKLPDAIQWSTNQFKSRFK